MGSRQTNFTTCTLIMLAILFFVFAICALGEAKDCPMEHITLSDGSDSNCFEKLKNDSYKLCGTFCSRTDNCNYWTWYEHASGSIYDDNDCLLCIDDEQTGAFAGAYSGESTCPASIEKEPSCPTHGITTIGLEKQPLTSISFDDGEEDNFINKIDEVGDAGLCGELCARTTACVYWTWYSSSSSHRSSNDCLMFDNIKYVHNNPATTSGDKFNPNTTPEDGCPNPNPGPDPGPGPDNGADTFNLPAKVLTMYLGIAIFVGLISASM